MQKPSTKDSIADIFLAKRLFMFTYASFKKHLNENSSCPNFEKELHPDKEFYDYYKDINNYKTMLSINMMSSFGIAMISYDEIIKSHSLDLNTDNQEHKNLFLLVNALRNCYAHSPHEPKWLFKKDTRILYKDIILDSIEINRKELKMNDLYLQIAAYDAPNAIITELESKNSLSS